ncbi:hypothetical protein AALP_AA2G241000 [Arabis alpina]|uniref:Uncharacterized protein n=1 Tax=Arabis alpina TaxID=50452 RepID=A0A087HJM0_ARAAL|nr:hypothetical protein AALP_AA2G241000 [Arabis alpina]
MAEHESESEGEEPVGGVREKKICLSPAHARDLHEDPKTIVDNIITDDGDIEVDESAMSWSDDEEDPKVKNLVDVINEDHNFANSMFIGGATKMDVARMVEDAKEKNVKGKQKKSGGNYGPGQCSGTSSVVALKDVECEAIAEMVAARLRDEIKRLELEGLIIGVVKKVEGKMNDSMNILEGKINGCMSRVEDLKAAISFLEFNIVSKVDERMKKAETEVIDGFKAYMDTALPIILKNTGAAVSKNVNVVNGNEDVGVFPHQNQQHPQVALLPQNQHPNQSHVSRSETPVEGGNGSEVGDNVLAEEGIVQSDREVNRIVYTPIVLPWTIAGGIGKAC